jgi:hypothetical protein
MISALSVRDKPVTGEIDVVSEQRLNQNEREKRALKEWPSKHPKTHSVLIVSSWYVAEEPEDQQTLGLFLT